MADSRQTARDLVNGWLPQPVPAKAATALAEKIEAALIEARTEAIEEIVGRFDAIVWPTEIYREIAEEVLDAFRAAKSDSRTNDGKTGDR